MIEKIRRKLGGDKGSWTLNVHVLTRGDWESVSLRFSDEGSLTRALKWLQKEFNACVYACDCGNTVEIRG
jgi:hypothetical protein